MLKKYIFLLLTGLIFGSQFVLVKIAERAYTPLDIGFMRVLFGVVAILILIPIFGGKEEKLNVSWMMYLWIGLLEGALPCVLVPWGQLYVPTGITGVIICTMPIFVMLFGPLLIKSERYSWLSTLSILVSFIGVVVLINPFTGVDGLANDWGPALLIVLASASWALSLVFIKRCPSHAPFKLTRNILIAAVLELFIVWLLFGHPTQFHITTIPLIAAFVLGFFASGVVYIFYVLLIRSSGVNFAAFSNYLVPIVAGVIAIIWLHERFDWMEVLGFMIIIVGLIIQTFRDFQRKG